MSPGERGWSAKHENTRRRNPPEADKAGKTSLPFDGAHGPVEDPERFDMLTAPSKIEGQGRRE